MPIFETPPLTSLPNIRNRWTPLYLEHGRLEVDDSSVKFISAEKAVISIPVASISVILLGPGTTITHAAIKACSDVNTTVCWTGEESVKFYAFGNAPTSSNENARKQISLSASKTKREEVARQMFRLRFPEVDVSKQSIKELMGMEGQRVRNVYHLLGAKHGVTWKGRNYNINNFFLSDPINRALSAANHAMYALCLSVIYSMGYLPQIGFVHSGGSDPFVYDISDLYKEKLSYEAAFETIGAFENAKMSDVIRTLKCNIEDSGLMKQIPEDINRLMSI